MYLLDSNIYIRAFLEPGFGTELHSFHRGHLGQLVLSAVVASEILVGAATPARERAVRLGLVEPFRTRRRFHTPSWTTWDRATAIDRRLRRKGGMTSSLAQRSFFNDILIAASARELGATIVTLNRADFQIIGAAVDIEAIGPWP